MESGFRLSQFKSKINVGMKIDLGETGPQKVPKSSEKIELK